MNQAASVPGHSLTPDTTDLFTAGQLTLIAIFALLVIAGLLWGIRNARRRRAAEAEITAHNAEVKQATKAAPVPADEEDLPPIDPAKANAPTELIFDRIPDAAPAAAAPAIAPAAGPSHADGPVTQMKGLGPKLAAKLAEHGITTVGQVAALTDDEAAALDARLGPFTGRMARDRWQEQARFLAAGDKAGFEAVFGKL